MIKHYLAPFIRPQKQKQLLIKIDIDDVFESIHSTIILNIHKFIEQGSGWVTDSVVHHSIHISIYIPSAGGRYIKLPIQLEHSKKGSRNRQIIDDNEYCKWCLVIYLNPAEITQQ